jgi:hypothetical protein
MRYEEMRLGGYVAELAKCFQSEPSVKGLLLDADVKLENLTPFGNATPLDYWQIVCQQIAFGAAIDGFVRVLAAAARRFPGNSLFSAFQSEPVKGSSARLRVLFLGALPAGRPQLRIDTEFQDIQDQLRRGTLSQPVEVVNQFGASPDNLLGAVLGASPGLLHYAGHANSDGALVLEGPAQAATVLAAEVVGKLLRAIEPKIRCVVLNACHSAEAAAALLEHTEVVVGTTESIQDRSALAFAKGFYAGLAHRTSVGVAAGLGRVQMDLHETPGADFVSVQARAGVDPSKVFLT